VPRLVYLTGIFHLGTLLAAVHLSETEMALKNIVPFFIRIKMKKAKIKMARVTRLKDDDRSFDLEFWQKAGAQARFEAAWDMVVQYELMRGKKLDQLRLDRSVTALKRKSG